MPSEVSKSIPLGALLEFPPVSPSFPFQVSTSSNWTTSQFSPVTRSSSRTCGASTGQSIRPSRATTAKERRTFSRWGTRRVGRAHSGFTSTPAESNLPPQGTKYWRFDNGVLDADYPRAINVGFDNIPDHLDAAFALPAPGHNGREKVYFFKGTGRQMTQRNTLARKAPRQRGNLLQLVNSQ